MSSSGVTCLGPHFINPALRQADFCHGLLDVPTNGTYEIEVTAWAEHDEGALGGADADPAKLEIVAEGNTETSAGATAIKAKLTELFSTLLGIPAGADDPEIEDAYDLFVTVWENTVDSSGPNFDMRCERNSDQYYFDGIVDDAWLEPADGEEWDWDRHGWDYDRLETYYDTIDKSDRHRVARTWVAMLAYLLTDYRYLFL